MMTVEKLSERMRDDDSISGSHFADKVEKLEQEVVTLKEQLKVFINGNTFMQNYIEMAKRAESAEAEVKRLSEQKFFEIKCSPELEKRLAELALDNLEKGARLAKAQELVEKWRRVEILANAEQVAIKMAHHKCADELDDALK